MLNEKDMKSIYYDVIYQTLQDEKARLAKTTGVPENLKNETNEEMMIRASEKYDNKNCLIIHSRGQFLKTRDQEFIYLSETPNHISKNNSNFWIMMINEDVDRLVSKIK